MRNFQSDIVAVASSRKKGAIVVFCEKEIVAYKPIVSYGNTVRWTRAFQKNCSFPIKDAFFSHDDQYVIGCAAQQLTIWRVEHQKTTILDIIEQNSISEMKEIFKVEVVDPIFNVKFTHDSRYFITQANKRDLRVWDFEAIKEFPADGDIDQLSNAILNHDHDLVSFKVRETQRISPSPLPTPTTVITLSMNHNLSVWQEQPYAFKGPQGEKRIQFFKIYNLSLKNVNSISFIYGFQPHPFPGNNIYIEADQLGVQDVEDPSLDYLLIHQEDEVQIVKLEQLRNYSLQLSVQQIHLYHNPKIMKMIKKMVYTNQIFENDQEKVEIVGFDKLWNIIKLVINLTDQADYRVYACEKFSYGKIVHFSYDPISDDVCIFNSQQLLCNTKASHLNFINQEYEVKQMEDFQSWKIELDENKYQHMYHIKDIVIFIPNTLEELLLLQLNQKCLVARSIKITNIIQKLERENFQFDQIKLISSSEQPNNSYELVFLLLRKNQVITLRVIISVQIFTDSVQQQHLQINYINKVQLNFPFDKLQFADSNSKGFDFFTIKNKSFSHYNYDGQLNLKTTITKSYQVVSCGYLKSRPYIYYAFSSQNEIDFHNADGDFLTRFNISLFLLRVDNAVYDASSVVVKIHPLRENLFFLQVENYLVVMEIKFDKNTQIYRLVSLKNPNQVGRNENYTYRMSKNSCPSEYQFIPMAQEGNILLKTGSSFRVINDSFNISFRDLEDPHSLPLTISLKTLRQYSQTQHNEPLFLTELLETGKLQLVNYIVHLMWQKLKQSGNIGNRFAIPLEQLTQLYMEANIKFEDVYPAWFLESQSEQSLSVELRQLKGDPVSNILKVIDSEEKEVLSLSEPNLSNLNRLLSYLNYANLNSRTLDSYAQIFMFHVHKFRNQPRTSKKSGSLTSKEVVWALHSIQKDTLWQECIDSQDNENDQLTWIHIRRYCAVYWMDTLDVFRQKLEKLANTAFLQTKDPFQSLLFYVMINKRTFAAKLFQKMMTVKPEYKSTFEFLMKDFNEERWKSAASKNAYALLSKKRYNDAASFFLVGGHLADAVNVMTMYLEDFQLALLCARLFEQGKQEQPVTQKLIKDFLIKSGETMNDNWLLHIAYFLLGQHVESVNCLYRKAVRCDTNIQFDQMGKKQCLSWSSKFEPTLSSFHPSIIDFAEKISDTIAVKREIQQSQLPLKPKQEDIFSSFYSDEEEEQQEDEVQVQGKSIQKNIGLLKEMAIEFYYNIRIPQLGLIIYHSLECEEPCDPQKVINQNVCLLVLDAIKNDDHKAKYINLLSQIDEYASYLRIDKELLYSQAYAVLSSVRSPSRSLTFSLFYNFNDDRFNQFSQFCTEAQALIYRLCYSYSMNAQTKEYYATLLQTVFELDTGIRMFQSSKQFQHNFAQIKPQIKSTLNVIKLLTHFTSLILTLELDIWKQSQDILKRLELFSHEVFAKQNHLFQYDGLRDDFIETVSEKVKVYFNNTKTKSKKASRNQDILAEAFPEDKYDQQVELDSQLTMYMKEISEHSELNLSPLKQASKQHDRNVCCEIILQSIIKSLIIKYFFSISKSFFSNYKDSKFNPQQLSYGNIFKLAEYYQHNRHNQVLGLLRSLKDYSIEQKILDDISQLAKTDTSYLNSEYFQNLEHILNPDVFYMISQKVHLENYCDLLSLQLNKQAFKYPRSTFDERNIIAYKNRLFRQGVEVYRIQKEPLRAFCINKAKGHSQEGVVLQGKQIRKINTLYNLKNRNRTQDGYGLVEEDTLFNDDIQTVKDEQLLSKPFIVRMTCSILSENDRFADQNFILKKHSNYHSIAQPDSERHDNKLINDFSDYSILSSHPHLPIFLTGGKGGADLFSFKQMQHITDYTTGHKDHVTVLKFNNEGDMFLGVDSNHNAFIWRTNRSHKSSLPLFSLSHKYKPTTDMCFINEGSVVATIHNSTSKPHFAIYDKLMPNKKNTIVSESFTGSDILFSAYLNTILIANGKKGMINFYDIRKNQIYQNLEVGAEIKGIQLNPYQNKVVTTCNDSTVKIFSLDSYEKTADIKPFRQDRKQPQITSLQVTENLAMVSASDGTISVVYFNV